MISLVFLRSHQINTLDTTYQKLTYTSTAPFFFFPESMRLKWSCIAHKHLIKFGTVRKVPPRSSEHITALTFCRCMDSRLRSKSCYSHKSRSLHSLSCGARVRDCDERATTVLKEITALTLCDKCRQNLSKTNSFAQLCCRIHISSTQPLYR